MNKEQLAKVQALAENAAVYVQEDGEGMRILACVSEENHFLAEGEETGESYQIDYSEVDLENDMFYRFQLMDNQAPVGWYAGEEQYPDDPETELMGETDHA
jgi:hypothetical protein